VGAACEVCASGEYPAAGGAECRSCKANGAQPQITGGNFTYLQPGVSCAWECERSGFYKWVMDAANAFCKPCPNGTSTRVSDWEAMPEGRRWSNEVDLTRADPSRSTQVRDQLGAQRESIKAQEACGCGDGGRMQTLVKTDPVYLTKMHVSAECSTTHERSHECCLTRTNQSHHPDCWLPFTAPYTIVQCP